MHCWLERLLLLNSGMHQNRLQMIFPFWCLLACVLHLALANCDHAITVSQQMEGTNCSVDGTATTCGSLQSAIDNAQLISASRSCVFITIPSGRHFITATTFFHSNLSAHFIGSGDNVTLLCNYTTPTSRMLTPFSSLSDPKAYTWYFNQSESISFENLNFEGCPYPIRLDTVATISIRDSSFSYFREAALDIYNCQNVTISGTRVEHNRGTGIVHIPYRGNTGGLSLGFNDVPTYLSSPRVEISNCTFTNNSATAESVFLTPSQAFSNQFFTGRGGGMGLFMNESFHNLSISVRDCVYQENYARSFGGGFYMVFNGFNTQHIVSVVGTRLLSNTGDVGGGGIQVAYIASGVPAIPHTADVSDCVFQNNTSPSGGGIYVYPSFLGGPGNLARLRRCHFIGNQGVGRATDYGAAVAMALLQLFGQVSTLPRHEVEDCVFQENSGDNGVVSIGYSPARFKGNNTFIANIGTALRIIGTVVEFNGTLTFRNNVAIETSALHLLSFGQMLFNRGLTINFEGNRGRFGASILIDTPTSSIAFDRLLFNPQCFILYEDLDLIPSQWTDVDISFTNNSAVLGSALYIVRVDTCSWFSLAPPFFNNSFILDWPIWNFGNNTNTGYDNQTDPAFYVETTPVKLDIPNGNVTAWPGESFSLTLTGLDQFDHQTTTSARFLFSQTGMDSASPGVRLNPEVILIDADTEDGTLLDTVTLTYWVTSEGFTASSNGETLGAIHAEVFDTLPVMTDKVAVLAAPCPGGYVITASGPVVGGSVCGCQDISEVIHCEHDQDTVVIKSGYWAVHVPGNVKRNLQFYPCPPGYCQCSQNSSLGNTRCVFTFTNSDPDLQCACGREGILCGKCRSGRGVSALLNRCISCHDASGMLILALIVVDVAVFLGVALLDLPLPPWVYPFFFYVQLVPYVAVHFPKSFERVGKYLFFISSALGFYFPYDFCLHGSMSALVSYTVRYIPVLVATVVYSTVVIFRYLRHMKSLQHHGLWWAGLLLYTNLLHTSMSILDCPSVPEADGSSTIRWFINGEVKCFTGGHLPLALLAIAVLLVCLALIPFTAAVAMDRLRRRQWLRHLAGPLTVSFKRELRWWSAVELGRRVLFLVFLIPFPRNTVAPMLVLTLTIAVYGFLQPYKSRWANAMEILLQIDFLLLLMLRTTPIIQDQYLKFPSPPPSPGADGDRCYSGVTGVAKISWILTPFYYIPLLVLAVTAVVYCLLYIRRRYADRVKVPLVVEAPKRQPVEVFVQSLVLHEMDEEDSGYVILTGGSSSRDSTRL